MDWWKDFFDEDYVTAWSAAGSFDNTAKTVDDVERLLGVPAAPPSLTSRVASVASPDRFRPVGTGSRESTSRPHSSRWLSNGTPGRGTSKRTCATRLPVGSTLRSTFSPASGTSPTVATISRPCVRGPLLRPNGVLVMELMHRDLVAHLYGQSVDHGGPVSEEGVTDWVTGVRTATVTHGAITKTFRMRLYTVTELVGMLHDAGFQQIDALGDLAGGPVSPESRLVLRAVK